MPELKVWQCIVAYRRDSAKQLAKRFAQDLSKILKALSGYQNRFAYHGHKSGKPGNATAAQADTNLDKAIQFLTNCAIPAQGMDKVSDHIKEKQNREQLEMLLAVVKEDRKIDDIKDDLKLMDPDWEKLKQVAAQLEFVKKKKRERNTNKLAKK